MSKSRLYRRTQKKIQHSSEIKHNEAQLLVYLKSCLVIIMIELIIKGQQQTHRLIK